MISSSVLHWAEVGIYRVLICAEISNHHCCGSQITWMGTCLCSAAHSPKIKNKGIFSLLWRNLRSATGRKVAESRIGTIVFSVVSNWGRASITLVKVIWWKLSKCYYIPTSNHLNWILGVKRLVLSLSPECNTVMSNVKRRLWNSSKDGDWQKMGKTLQQSLGFSLSFGKANIGQYIMSNILKSGWHCLKGEISSAAASYWDRRNPFIVASWTY